MSKGKYKDPLKSLFSYKRSYVYIALEDLNLEFTNSEIEVVVRHWFHGWSLSYISEVLNREADELAVLLLALAERTKALIIPRNRGIWVSSEMEFETIYKMRLTKFMEQNPNGYLVFQDFNKVDFIWDERHFKHFESLWECGFSIDEISSKVKRNRIDVALLILDRLRKGFIRKREGGLKGVSAFAFKESRRKKDRIESAVS